MYRSLLGCLNNAMVRDHVAGSYMLPDQPLQGLVYSVIYIANGSSYARSLKFTKGKAKETGTRSFLPGMLVARQEVRMECKLSRMLAQSR